MRVVVSVAVLGGLWGCQGELGREDAPPLPPIDGPVLVLDDGGTSAGDAGSGAGADAGPIEPVEPIEPPAVPDAGHVRSALAADLRLVRADFFQAVRVPLVIDGAEADRRDLPVIAAREALVRVFAEALAGWTPREIRAVLEIDAGGTVRRFTDTRIPALPASSGDPDSVFAIHVPPDAVIAGASYRLSLEDPSRSSDTDPPDARWPRDGSFAPLGAESIPPLTLVLVPFRYETDGSNRLPNTSDEILARYRAELTARFPFSEIDLRVHEVVAWDQPTRLSGNVDWGDVNAFLIDLRDAERAPEHEYWYGLISPDTSRAAYCDAVAGSCTTGQSYVSTLHGTRVGSGVGFGDARSVVTLAHELGHMHGRYHAPCGTSGDSGYPYDGGRIGVWGWDRRDGTFHDPDVATDVMSYCDDQWISDYTYRALHLRHRALHGGLGSTTRATTPDEQVVTIETPTGPDCALAGR